jgi:hypothetical protein
MSRPVHYVDTTTTDYTFVSKDPWVLQFRATPQEQARLRQPRSLLSTRRGGFRMRKLKVSIVPGPPVDGKLLIDVAGERF